jgi:hypothetical protein
MHTRHKVIAALAVILAVAGWLAWNMLTVGSDLAAGG